MTEQSSISVTTTSQVINWNPKTPNLPAAQPPIIQVNGVAIAPPPYPPPSPTGFQLVIFDVTQTIPTPASILLNEYICVFPAQYGNPGQNGWMNQYENVYFWIVNGLLLSGRPDDQLIILASFGLDANMAPDNEALASLIQNGAGAQIQYWVKHCDPGSQVANATSWVAFPANYIYIGFGNSGYGVGKELYQAAGGSSQVTSTLNVNLPLGASAEVA